MTTKPQFQPGTATPAYPACRPGDTAVVISGLNLGKIVQVERLYTNSKEVISGSTWVDAPGKCGPAWVVHSLSGPLFAHRTDGGEPHLGLHMTRVMSDFLLRPLRDSDGSDESLMWKPLTRKRKTKATKRPGVSA